MEDPSDKRRSKEKNRGNRKHEDGLKPERLVFDPENFPRCGFKYFTQVLGHGRRDAVSNEDDNHGSEGDHQTIATIGLGTQDATEGRLDDIPAEVVDNFSEREPHEGLGEFFHSVILY